LQGLRSSTVRLSGVSVQSLTRSFASSSVAMTRISDSIIHDHAELDQQYKNIKNAKDLDTKERWKNQFTWELARHSVAEELLVYPAMEKYLGNKGKAAADKDRAEHQTVNELLHKIVKLKVSDHEFDPTLDQLMTNLSQHIKEEEKDDLPALENAMGAADSANLEKNFRRTKMFVPTEPHPSVSRKPPFETVAGILAAPIDHIKDLFKKFPEESKSELPP